VPNFLAINQTVPDSGDMAIFFHFQDGGCRHLRFLTFLNLNGRYGQEAKLRLYAKFRCDRSNRCGYMGIFRFFQDGGGPVLIF